MSPESYCNGMGAIKGLSFMDANNLEGTLPPEISLLGHSLQFLIFNRQLELRGGIPTEIGHLTKLTELILSTTGLSGTLPTEFGLLRVLDYLVIAHNEMVFGTIPTELGNLSNLTRFQLVKSNLTGSFPKEFLKLKQLEVFYLDNSPGLDTASVLPDVVGNMHQLECLSLVSRTFGEAMPIPSQIGFLRNMSYLMLKNWKIIGTIPAELGGLTKLESLTLPGNSITGTLPEDLFALTHLFSLKLGSNKMEGTLPPDLFSKLSCLQQLHINDNEFIGSIPTEVGLLSSLKKLEMRNTNLSGTIPTEMLALDDLTSLVVANASLSGSIPERLCGKLDPQQLKCFGGQCYQVKSEIPVCQGTSLCGCDCVPCE
ncbi:STYKc [Seminavis robusta]|uniref:STYKc n=1 Tax=Seminavis robusta TaxID=568900 RepID=A0A9N8HWD8_9STRA|nr:STYKc [Seminavis robusta]|eukprot:Sro1637_g287620.1 STYKc (370) ;mRNA; r:5309-6762